LDEVNDIAARHDDIAARITAQIRESNNLVEQSPVGADYKTW
jgi:hypothetical protein